MVSIMTDLHDFWTYENREVIVTDAKEGSEALGPFPLNGPTLYIHPPDMSTLCHKYVGHIDPVRFSFPSHSFVHVLLNYLMATKSWFHNFLTMKQVGSDKNNTLCTL